MSSSRKQNYPDRGITTILFHSIPGETPGNIMFTRSETKVKNTHTFILVCVDELPDIHFAVRHRFDRMSSSCFVYYTVKLSFHHYAKPRISVPNNRKQSSYHSSIFKSRLVVSRRNINIRVCSSN